MSVANPIFQKNSYTSWYTICLCHISEVAALFCWCKTKKGCTDCDSFVSFSCQTDRKFGNIWAPPLWRRVSDLGPISQLIVQHWWIVQHWCIMFFTLSDHVSNWHDSCTAVHVQCHIFWKPWSGGFETVVIHRYRWDERSLAHPLRSAVQMYMYSSAITAVYMYKCSARNVMRCDARACMRGARLCALYQVWQYNSTMTMTSSPLWAHREQHLYIYLG